MIFFWRSDSCFCLRINNTPWNFLNEQSPPVHLIHFICHFSANTLWVMSNTCRNRRIWASQCEPQRLDVLVLWGLIQATNSFWVLAKTWYCCLHPFQKSQPCFVCTNYRFSLLRSMLAVIFVRIPSMANLLYGQLVWVYIRPRFLLKHWAHRQILLLVLRENIIKAMNSLLFFSYLSI